MHKSIYGKHYFNGVRSATYGWRFDSSNRFRVRDIIMTQKILDFMRRLIMAFINLINGYGVNKISDNDYLKNIP